MRPSYRPAVSGSVSPEILRARPHEFFDHTGADLTGSIRPGHREQSEEGCICRVF